MSNYNAFRENFPPGFHGIEGEEEKEFSFHIQGEPIEINNSRENALEELRDKTIRELEANGTIEIN